MMTSHAAYDAAGRTGASTSPETYLPLRELGFDGVAITDSCRSWAAPVERWAPQAMLAGRRPLALYERRARAARDRRGPLAAWRGLDAVSRALRRACHGASR